MMRSLALVVLTLVLVGGCLSARSVQRRYYVLRVESATLAAPVSDEVGGRLYVQDLSPETVYDNFKLVVRQSPYVLRYSASHGWAVRPNRMVSDIYADTLSHSGLFETVSRQLADGRPDYTLGGQLRAIELVADGDDWKARVAIDLQLIRFVDGELLWSWGDDATRTLPKGDYDAVAEAASTIVEDMLRRSVAELINDAPRIRSVPVEVGPRSRSAR